MLYENCVRPKWERILAKWRDVWPIWKAQERERKRLAEYCNKNTNKGRMTSTKFSVKKGMNS